MGVKKTRNRENKWTEEVNKEKVKDRRRKKERQRKEKRNREGKIRISKEETGSQDKKEQRK